MDLKKKIQVAFNNETINSNRVETMLELADEYAIGFAGWLMDNCELYEDKSLWSYNSEDYTMQGLLTIYKSTL